MKIIGIISIVLLLFSCQDLRKEKQLKEIAALQTEVNEIREKYLSEKVDTLGLMAQRVMDVEFRIRSNFVSDTIAKVLGVKINAYKMVRKRVRPLGRAFNQLDKGTKEESETLKKLKSDIENDLGERAKYDEFITFEKKKVEQLKIVEEEMLTLKKYCFENFKKYHEELSAFSWTLIKDKNKK